MIGALLLGSTVWGPVVRGALAAVLAGSVVWVGFLVALRWLPDARVATRWCGAAVVGLWLLVASFWLLSLLHAFRLPVVVVGWLAAAWVVHGAVARRAHPLASLRRDAARVGGFFRSLDRWQRLLIGAVAAVAGARFFRALGSPPLGWDDLTYHLVKAAHWVQAGGFAGFRAPDAWGAYSFLPVTGEVLWSWALLPLHGDALLAPAALGVWALIPLATYAAARELGGGRSPALLSALAVAAMPAALAYVGSAYVDNVTLAAFLLGAVFLVRAVSGRASETSLALAGLALAAGTKLTALPILLLGGAVLVVSLVCHRPAGRRRLVFLAACGLAATVAVPSYARSWIERGSPIYPFGVRVAGVELVTGNLETERVTEELVQHAAVRLSTLDALWFLVSRPAPLGGFLNPGIGAVVLLLLAVPAVGRLGPGDGLAGIFLWGSALYLLGLFLSGAMEVVRTTVMVTTAGRYLTPTFGALGVLASRIDGRLPRGLWSVAIVAGVLFALPGGWSVAGAEATVLVALLVAAGAGCGLALARLPGRRSPLVGLLVGLVVVSGVIAGVDAVRGRFRDAVYEAAADWVDPAYQIHALHPRYASAWPLWQAVDGRRPRTLAVTCGFVGEGHNAYLYPLFGQRLQNRVVYVPVAANGAVIDYWDRAAVAAQANRACWLERLRDARIDTVASLAPRTTVEERWMEGLPEVFEPTVVTSGGLHALYRVHWEDLDRRVRAERCSQGAQGESS